MAASQPDQGRQRSGDALGACAIRRHAVGQRGLEACGLWAALGPKAPEEPGSGLPQGAFFGPVLRGPLGAVAGGLLVRGGSQPGAHRLPARAARHRGADHSQFHARPR